MRRILIHSAIMAGGLFAQTVGLCADYPPYASASAPSDQFRIGDPAIAPQAIPSTPALSPEQSLPAEVPWGQAGAPYEPVLMGQNSLPFSAPAPTATSTIISPTPAACDERLIESTWYTRADYFHWNERVDGADFLNEDGVLVTLGYVHRFGPERVRAELFGSQVNYGAPMGGGDFLSSHTDYLGVRGEYDLLYDPEVFPSLSLFGGIGTRFWIRNLPDAVTNQGVPIVGYEETWWTIYPYMGMETKRSLHSDAELYGMGRIGLTAFTYEHASVDDIVLYPRPGVTGQLEGGLRGRHLFLAAFFEGISWNHSPVVRGWLQPTSTMYTVGLKTGTSF